MQPKSRTCQQMRELYLGTTERFLAAHRFYEKNGFARVDPASLPKAFHRMSVDTRFHFRAPGQNRGS
jgi:hypothetical protein